MAIVLVFVLISLIRAKRNYGNIWTQPPPPQIPALIDSLSLSHVSGNRIVALPSTLFESVPRLQQLRLDHNELSVLSSRLFHPLTRLVVMDLSSNLLQADCDTCLSKRSFQGLASLIVLNLSKNQISRLQPGMFEDLANLQILDGSHNRIEQIPQGNTSK